MTPNRPKNVYRRPGDRIPKSKHYLRWNHPKLIPMHIPDILDNTCSRRGRPIRSIQPRSRPDWLTHLRASNISRPRIMQKRATTEKLGVNHLPVTKQASDAASAFGQQTTKSLRKRRSSARLNLQVASGLTPAPREYASARSTNLPAEIP